MSGHAKVNVFFSYKIALFNRNKEYCKTLEILVGKGGVLWEYFHLYEAALDDESYGDIQKLGDVEKLCKKLSDEWLWSKENFPNENEMLIDPTGRDPLAVRGGNLPGDDDTRIKELVEKRMELEDRVYGLETNLGDMSLERDDLKKLCFDKEKSVSNLQRKVSLLMCEHRSIENNLVELEDILESQSKMNMEKEKEICDLKERLMIVQNNEIDRQESVMLTQDMDIVTGLTIENEDLRAHLTNSQILLKNMQRELKMVKDKSHVDKYSLPTSYSMCKGSSSDKKRGKARYHTLATSGNMSTTSNYSESYYR